MSEPRPLTSQLPAKPSLRHLKDQAKDRLRSGQAPSLAVAQFQIARLYGFQSWPKLRSHVLARTMAGKLKAAIDQDDLEKVQSLISKHPELKDAPIGYGEDGPLTWAAECRGRTQPSPERLAIAEWLIRNGSDIHQGGDAPLMRASLDGSRTPMMDLLVRFGANVNAAWHGHYPVIFAPCETLDPIALDWLLRHGADPNCGDSSTWQSSGRQHPGTALDSLLGTYVRNQHALNTSIRFLQDAGGTSQYDQPGVIAVIRGDLDALQELLQRTPDLLTRRYPSLNIGATAGRMLTLQGATLLHVAAEFGQAEAAKLCC